MPGKHITRRQVGLYMKNRLEGLEQTTSAAKSGMSERTGRRIECGQHQLRKSHRRESRRKDPLEEVWEQDLKPKLEEEPLLTPMTLLEILQKEHPEEYPDNVLRTLQRRVKEWKALYGPEKELVFLQDHPVGVQGLSDFTTLKGIEVTIQGGVFQHLLYHFRLAFSGWSYMNVVCGGESYTALTAGLQEALWRLGGSPLEHRTDHLSAAFKNYSKDQKKQARKELTERYEEFCRHYNIKPTHNNLGEAHENGSVEGPHGHLKRRIKQALLLRGSTDFKNIAEYQSFIEEVVGQHNRRNAKTVELERQHLQPLPKYKATDFDEITVKATSTGTIQVKRVTYALPSRLMGEKLRVHVYDDRIKCYLGSALVFVSARKYPKDRSHRVRVINYRYMIDSLKKKPQAFRYCSYRDDLLPNDDYRLIWEYVDNNMDARDACKYIVGLLSLAAEGDCEDALSVYVLENLTQPEGITPPLAELKLKFISSCNTKQISVEVHQHKLKDYDELLTQKNNVLQGGKLCLIR